ncbi:prolyl aminopeptidase [Catenovulum sp. SM1970]|uniref:prolyl aminopeptidase n=1 Tax=Marinifaba aquimaris TaxID=2741323 RepID=UPI00157470F7|nr:prolyl aminopeptidase [Marinifaba aquimaris]NTS76959.1 prolyl aminopeptidase [Marinifaba aquimaris]
MIYPEIQPFNIEWLTVSGGHSIYLEQSGNPDGIPVVYLHGGPGGASSPFVRRMFDPEKYHIVLFDQRGCGQSQPFCQLTDNTTDDLIADIELIRQHLNIKSWLVTGGSWGTTLALLYAQAYPQYVKALLLRGIFLSRQQDYDWLYHPEGGAARLFPDFYQDFIKTIGQPSSTQNLLSQYLELLTSKNELAQMQAARSWCLWETRISKLNPSPQAEQEVADRHICLPMALLEAHYFANDSFILANQIMSNMDKIADIPATIIHGRYDAVCDVSQAFTLSQAWPASQLYIVPSAGHSFGELPIAQAFVKGAQAFAEFLTE